MSMVIVTVPPVGPPVAVPIGKAVFQSAIHFNNTIDITGAKLNHDPIHYLKEPKIYLDDRFDVPQDSFYLNINKGMEDERRIFANGTILFRYLYIVIFVDFISIATLYFMG